MMTDNAIYERKLDSVAKKEIRLLHFEEPGNGDDQDILRCTLSTVSLYDRPNFVALSYVWGDTWQRTPIVLNDINTDITLNLSVALSSMRDRFRQLGTGLRLWADAVCIDQQNIDERNEQVRLMKDVFSQASSVIVWLGDGDEDSDWFLDHVMDTGFRDRLSELRSSSRPPNEDELKAQVIIERNINVRQWWGRTWTIQELVLAQHDLVIACGTRIVPWPIFVEAQDQLSAKYWRPPDLDPQYQRIKEKIPTHPDRPPGKYFISSYPLLKDIRQHYSSHGHCSLQWLLFYCGVNRVSVEHDHIYGMLGMLPPHEALSIMVDYRKPVMELFHDVMKQVWRSNDSGLMAAMQDLAFTHFNSPNGAESATPLPSWVPDFTLRRSKGPRDFQPFHHIGLRPVNKFGVHNGRHWKSATEAEIAISADGKVLSMNALELDTIAETLHVKYIYMTRLTKASKGVASVLRKAEALINGARIRPIDPAIEPLRSRESASQILTDWHEELRMPEAPEVDRDVLWEIMLGRKQVPETLHSQHQLGLKPEQLRDALLSPLMYRLRKRISERQVFVTEAGFAGVAVDEAAQGDLLVFPFGGTNPFVLRPMQTKDGMNGFYLVGIAYLGGFSDFAMLDEYYGAGFFKGRRFSIY